MRPYAWPIAAVLALAVLLAALQAVAVSRRNELDAQRVIEVASAADAYAALREAQVNGRILVVLDQGFSVVDRVWPTATMRALADPAFVPPVHSYDMVSALIYSGIARSVYYVPPARLWSLEAGTFAARPDSLLEGTGYRIRVGGVPVRLATEEGVLETREKMVVYIAGTLQGEYNAQFLQELTDPARSDVVVIQGGAR